MALQEEAHRTPVSMRAIQIVGQDARPGQRNCDAGSESILRVVVV